MKQLTEEEKLRQFEPFINRYKEMLLLAFDEGYVGEKGVLEYYLTVIKMAYYKQELRTLKIQKITPITETPVYTPQNLSWTATKTDLVELMYATYAIGAIQNGNVDIKSLAKLFETLFDIDLGNFYKTYGEIRAREKDRTKFLDKLRFSLLRKMENDDG